jgi:SAM-dependent methyltransferase
MSEDADVDRTVRAYDEIAAEFADRTWLLPLDGTRRDFLSALEADRPGVSLRILDAGCGPGRDVAWFRRQGHHAIGGDLSAGMLNEARQRVPNASFVRMDLREPPFRPQTFDAVWLCASILHLPKDDWLPTLHRYRSLLEGGHIFVSVKEGEGERSGADRGTPYARRFFTYTTESELRVLLGEAGFQVLTLRRSPGEPGHDWLQGHAEAQRDTRRHRDGSRTPVVARGSSPECTAILYYR